MEFNEANYFVQKDKYKNRAMKFLFLGGASVVATMGAIVMAPALGALAIPTIAVATLTGATSVLGVTANKVAEGLTDVYEDKSMRKRFSSGLKAMREKSFDVGAENKLRM